MIFNNCCYRSHKGCLLALLENRTSMTKHFRHKWFRIRHKICFMTNLWRIWVRRRRSVIFDTRWRIIIFRHKCLILPWRFVVSHITWLFSWQEQIITVFVMKPTCHVPSSMLAYDMASDDVVATWHHLRWQMTWHRPHRLMTWRTRVVILQDHVSTFDWSTSQLLVSPRVFF